MEMSTKHFRKREAILSYLQGTKAHPSAEEVYTALKHEIPDLSLATVYRNLSLFKKQGLASGIATVNGVERFDGNCKPHVHFICEACGAVQDLDMPLPESLQQSAESHCGGRIGECHLSFTGTCRNCL